MFEQGDGTKLSDEVIEKIAKKFNLSITSGAAQQPAPIVQVAASSVRGFCPNPHCPSNHEYFVEEMRLFRPDREAADPVVGRFCALCGETVRGIARLEELGDTPLDAVVNLAGAPALIGQDALARGERVLDVVEQHVERVAHLADLGVPWFGWIPAYLATAVLLGWALTRWVEQPAFTLLNKGIDALPRRTARTGT